MPHTPKLKNFSSSEVELMLLEAINLIWDAMISMDPECEMPKLKRAPRVVPRSLTKRRRK